MSWRKRPRQRDSTTLLCSSRTACGDTRYLLCLCERSRVTLVGKGREAFVKTKKKGGKKGGKGKK
eukprot:368938-Hanusia_phi.AAC.1